MRGQTHPFAHTIDMMMEGRAFRVGEADRLVPAEALALVLIERAVRRLHRTAVDPHPIAVRHAVTIAVMLVLRARQLERLLVL